MRSVQLPTKKELEGATARGPDVIVAVKPAVDRGPAARAVLVALFLVLFFAGAAHAGGFKAVAASDTSCPDAELTPTPDTLPRIETAMLCLLNDRRRDAGLKPFTRDERLDASATFQSIDMVRSHYFAHELKGHPTLLQRVLTSGYFSDALTGLYAENIGNGPNDIATASAVVGAWMDSFDHRQNILDGRLQNIGFGTVMAEADPVFYSDRASTVFTTDFGRRDVALSEPARATCAAPAKRAASHSGSATPRRPWCVSKKAHRKKPTHRKPARKRAVHKVVHHTGRRASR